jgi:hypothetical protein
MTAILRSLLVLALLAFAATTPASADDQKFSKQQLDQMLAPIALYPDELLSNVLMASTYPLDVVEAERWRIAPANAGLKGAALTDALKSKTWDPSIKALVQFPDVLKMMSDQLDWTQKLGDAFIAQQDEVMNEVQFLRKKADSSGHLRSNSQQSVTQDDGAYIIRPVDPEVVYVPVYEPAVVYGPWWYPDYPPYYWGYPGASFIDGYYWGLGGVAIIGGIWGWNHWNWHNNHLDINVNRWNAINGNRRPIDNQVWRHDADHRWRGERGGKDFNRADIERRLQGTDHALVNKNFNHGEQLRKNGANFSKAPARNPQNVRRHTGQGAGNHNYVKRNGGGKAARPANIQRSHAVNRGGGGARHGGARHGGGRRR